MEYRRRVVLLSAEELHRVRYGLSIILLSELLVMGMFLLALGAHIYGTAGKGVAHWGYIVSITTGTIALVAGSRFFASRRSMFLAVGLAILLVARAIFYGALDVRWDETWLSCLTCLVVAGTSGSLLLDLFPYSKLICPPRIAYRFCLAWKEYLVVSLIAVVLVIWKEPSAQSAMRIMFWINIVVMAPALFGMYQVRQRLAQVYPASE